VVFAPVGPIARAAGTDGDGIRRCLGDAALVLPGGSDHARSELKRVLFERYKAGLVLIDDPDLADQ